MSTLNPNTNSLPNNINASNFNTSLLNSSSTYRLEEKPRYTFNQSGNTLSNVANGLTSSETLAIFYGIPIALIVLILIVILIRCCMLRSKSNDLKKAKELKKEIQNSQTMKTVKLDESIV